MQGVREQFANVSEEERPEAVRERFGGTKREGRIQLSQLSEEDHEKFREELREVMARARAEKMTEEETKRAMAEIVEKYR